LRLVYFQIDITNCAHFYFCNKNARFLSNFDITNGLFVHFYVKNTEKTDIYDIMDYTLYKMIQ